MIRRFLRAGGLDTEKASKLFLKYLTWKRSYLLKGHISESEIANDLSHKKVCMQGHDKMGRPIVVAFGSRHNPSKGNPEEFKRESLYIPLCIHIFLVFRSQPQVCFWSQVLQSTRSRRYVQGSHPLLGILSGSKPFVYICSNVLLYIILECREVKKNSQLLEISKAGDILIVTSVATLLLSPFCK